MRRLTNLLDKVIFACSSLLTALLLSLVLLQTFCRNLFHFSFVQLEELCILMLAWLAFLSAAYAVRHCAHVAVDFFFNKMSRPVRYWLNFAVILALIGLTLYLAYYGYGLAMRQMRTPLPVTHIPRGYIYMAAPVCSVFMFLFFCDALVECVTKRSISGVVTDTDQQITEEIESGRKLADEVLGAKGKVTGKGGNEL